MEIAGGIYAERCRHPSWDRLFGSGLRAAIAVSKVSPGSNLHSYVATPWKDDIAATLQAFELGHRLTQVPSGIVFEYLHPFGLMSSSKPERAPTILDVQGDVVLRFGMVEGDAKVIGKRVVYDPQFNTSNQFTDNGSQATEQLALIVTLRELFELARRNDAAGEGIDGAKDAISDLRDTYQGPRPIVVVKDRLGGAHVFNGDDAPVRILPVHAQNYFRIGSGDVFAAAFAHAWGEQKKTPEDAATYAAQCVAFFVDGSRLPLPSPGMQLPTLSASHEPTIVRILGQGSLALENLIFDTGRLVEDLGRQSVTGLLSAPQSSDSTSTLIFVGADWDAEQLAHFDAQSAGGFRVVYCPDAIADVSGLFPGARLTSDYATAVYQALQGQKK